MDFYSPVTRELFTKSINYGKSITTIEEEVITTIFHAFKSLLFDKTSVWVEKDNTDFDVTMVSYEWGLSVLVGRTLSTVPIN